MFCLIQKLLLLSPIGQRRHQGTVFGNWYADIGKEYLDGIQETMKHQKPSLPSEHDAVFMYKYAAHYLRFKGYEHYEISSYAFKSPQEQRNNNTMRINRNRSTHNQIYWALNSQWYAFGLGATSYVNGALVARPRRLVDYYKWVEDIPNKNQVGTNRVSKRIPDIEMMMDIVLKRLRTSEGLSIKWIREQFVDDDVNLGVAYIDAIMKGAQVGLDLELVVYDEQHDLIRLTEPDGFLLSNSIISNVFVHMEDIRLLYPVGEQ
jgi:coproporphyrinogen III oxidase-like Fe-S oxidoreductase